MKYRTLRRKPTKVVFDTKKGFKTFVDAMKISYPAIELKGEPIESFERVSKIKEIILLGEDGEVRRIVIR